MKNETRATPESLEPPRADGEPSAKSFEEVRLWILTYVGRILGVHVSEIDATVPFDRYGLDSSAAVGMTGDLERWLGLDLDPTVAYDHPTIDALATYLARLSAGEEPAP